MVSNSRIIGHVYSEKGSQLGSAKVTCNEKKTITLFDGSYEFKNIEPGTYTITASLKGFKSQNKVITIQKDDIMTLDFQLSEAIGTAKIYGTVYDAGTKRPVTSGGTIILILPIVNRYALLDKNGYYEFNNLAEDSYDLWASIPGYEDVKATITVAEGEKKVQDFYCKPILNIEPPWG
ncbi:MAG: carboxypeptidase regulatory-like domain-containing protein [archaeon]|nr:carboxypeptidase regulatory-like domain-containing protein [archaeon]MCP8320271.1 carboxypeptidase regulatory-like domain-containing protein [archaeon]